MFEFDYQVLPHGWSEVRVSDGEHVVLVEAWRLSDALRDLLEAVVLAVEGVREARCSWLHDDPGEWRWVFRRLGEEVELRVLEFDTVRDAPDEQGREIFRTVQPARRLGRVVLSAGQRVLDEFGEQDGTDEWVEYPFPVSQLERLRRAIKLGAT